MECNKEEAIRAKEVAESKMLNKDFSAARKIALKAQRLYEDLENISQMLLVCDVHCAAEHKLFGSEMDWYGILKVESTVDETTIKKQYRKLALQLHPDKNKFPGAEAAFKLIGEAQRLLLDRQKRYLHDIKRKSSTNKPAPHYRPHQTHRAAPNPTFRAQNDLNQNFINVNFQHPPQSAAQPGFSNGRPTFWTACPFCNVRFQFHIEVINKSIICQSCNKPFAAYERSMTGGPMPRIFTQPVFPQKKNVQNQSACKVEPGQKGSAKVEQSKTEFFQKKGSSSEFVSERVNRKKRKKQESESSDSSSSDSSSSDESEADVIMKDGEFKAGTNFGSSTERPRRSDRRKLHVSYKENVSDEEDEDFVIPSEKKKSSKSSFAAEEDVNGCKEVGSEKYKQPGVDADLEAQNVKGKEKVEENGSEKDTDNVSDTSSGSKVHPENYEVPDPDFKNFDKDRQEDCFKVGQIWAVYDTLDAMPRFYARIRKVFSPGFKVKVTWLEPEADDEDKLEWVEEGLPVSCGKYKHGLTEDTVDHPMFSHLMLWENGGQRDTFRIIPRMGQTWALFKNWDINWKSNATSHQGEFEYEFVEILSNYTEGDGVSVAYLGKVMGFVSLFCRISKGGRDSVLIKHDELYRFSHMVPSFKLTGNEKKSVPKGSLELDPAALPRKIEEISVSKDSHTGTTAPSSSFSRVADEVKIEGMPSNISASACKADTNGSRLQPDNGDSSIDEDCSSPDSSAENIECPEPEFFDFDAAKSRDKFEEGQIWALYSDEEGLPKYYGKIVKVDTKCDFEVQLKWLIAFPLSKDMIRWQDKDMPVCCGRFKVQKGIPVRTYSSAQIGAFSHQVTPVIVANEKEYTILPKNGEVWALYKNWSSNLKSSNLENYEYSIVEVLQVNENSIGVSLLERVDGFNSVFKAQAGGSSSFPFTELLRFSHHIPAFRLTGERNGSLRGFWELDLAALPVSDYAYKFSSTG